MKKTGKCPKCDSDQIIHRGATGAGGDQSRAVHTGLTVFSAKKPEMFICKSCGYIEEYFTPEQLPSLE